MGSILDVALTYLEIQLFSSSMFRIIRIAKVIGRVGRLLKVASGSSTQMTAVVRAAFRVGQFWF